MQARNEKERHMNSKISITVTPRDRIFIFKRGST